MLPLIVLMYLNYCKNVHKYVIIIIKCYTLGGLKIERGNNRKTKTIHRKSKRNQ